MPGLGIDLQTIFGMPPLEHVRLAARLECSHISIGLSPVPWNPCKFSSWSLRDDPQLRREMRAVMSDNNIVIAHGEGFVIRPDSDVSARARDMDLMLELGALNVNTVSMEPDRGRALDELGRLAEMAAARSMGLSLEFAPPHPINTLKSAIAAIEYVGLPHLKLVLDTMHYFRSGGTLSEIAELPVDQIGYVQLSDVPWEPPHDDYMREACFERLIPGEGQLPLSEFLTALPGRIPIGIEIPMLAAASEGRLEEEITRAIFSVKALPGFSKAVELT